MQQLLVQWESALLTVFIASIVGGISYCSCRKWKFTFPVFGFFTFLYVCAVAASGAILLLIPWLYALIVCFAGAIAHSKSYLDDSESEYNLGSSFYLVSNASICAFPTGIIIGICTGALFDINLEFELLVRLFIIYFPMVVLAPALTALLFYMLKTSRLRPGIDTHFPDAGNN